LTIVPLKTLPLENREPSALCPRIYRYEYHYSVVGRRPNTVLSDASDFLRKHPWPGRSIADTWNEDDHREGRHSKRCFNAMGVLCGKAGGDYDDYDDDVNYEQNPHVHTATDTSTRTGGGFVWTLALQQSFREELEKLIILGWFFVYLTCLH
jgi:hypothetical protein